MTRLHRALLAVAASGVLALALSPALAMGGNKKSPCKQKYGKKCQKPKQGRMTGHGTVISSYGRSHHEFRNSVCNSDRFPDLKVQWDGNRFDLTAYSSPLTCVDRPGFDEGQPDAGFDTIVGQGTGVLNGVAGASATFSFTDAGEPGRGDRATITITDASGNVVFDISDVEIERGGNHQAHRR